ncbi:MAG TPA: HEAT repeat domain-containing protein [Pyrinomonadaceae bacterium]|nr:HEAT repeat domain-containing protein [Pyrinomonadaceae bacterium]
MRKLYICGVLTILWLATVAACAHGGKLVEGSSQNLTAKADAALELARARPTRTRFWLAQEFSLREGVAIDSVPGVSGIATGKLGEFETKRAGLFLLYEPDAATIVDLKILSLDRDPDVGGLPVFWVERAGDEESLELLRRVLRSNPSGAVAQQAVVAVALHDEASVPTLLQQIVRDARDVPVRATAVSWLGRLPGQADLLAGLVRDEREPADVRHAAVTAIAKGREPASLPTLESLYRALADKELKAHIIRTVAKSEDKGAASEFLIRVAESEPDESLRQQALTSINKKLYRRKGKK